MRWCGITDRCIACRVCERQCANEVHRFDRRTGRDGGRRQPNASTATGACPSVPTRALKIVKTDHTFKENANWTGRGDHGDLPPGGERRRAALLHGESRSSFPSIGTRSCINASQVTNPSIDPLREPMETKVFLGQKARIISNGTERAAWSHNLPPQLELSRCRLCSPPCPTAPSATTLTRAWPGPPEQLGICYNTGEGGLHEDFYQYGPNTIVQVASGRFGVHKDYLEAGAAIEIKMGQGAKPGIGGHLPGAKIVGDISSTRMIPEGLGRHLPCAPPRYLLH